MAPSRTIEWSWIPLRWCAKLHPGQKNTLDALCKRYSVDNSRRDFHGALLDAEILADIYLMMTCGQSKLSLKGAAADVSNGATSGIRRLVADCPHLRVCRANTHEFAAHAARLDDIEESSGGRVCGKNWTLARSDLTM